jgi:hypothetical protein
MSKRTVRANARTMSKTAPHPDADLIARGLEILGRLQSQNDLAESLAAEFDAAWKEEDAIAHDEAKTDNELGAAVARTGELADSILSLSGADHLATIKPKARVYLWAESETLESLSKRAAVTADKALISLLRDLGADRPIASEMEKTGIAR